MIKHPTIEIEHKFTALCVLKELLKDDNEFYWRKFTDKIAKRLAAFANWNPGESRIPQRGGTCFNKFMVKYDNKAALAFW